MQRISLENIKGLDIYRKRITFMAEGFFFISKYVFVFIKDRMWIILKDVVACIEGNETFYHAHRASRVVSHCVLLRIRLKHIKKCQSAYLIILIDFNIHSKLRIENAI